MPIFSKKGFIQAFVWVTLGVGGWGGGSLKLISTQIGKYKGEVDISFSMIGQEEK